MTHIPTLETPRLILRAHGQEDYASACAMWADPVVTRYIGGTPATAEDVWSRMLRYAGLWSTLGYGYWVIAERATGAFIGEIGFADFKRIIVPAFGDRPEAGWALLPAEQERGYATEAISAAIEWGRRNLKASEVVCMIDPENLASHKVALKCGFKPYADSRYRGAVTRLYSRTL
jgi:RimJ/RimL family protein N-acetyltransferase